MEMIFNIQSWRMKRKASLKSFKTLQSSAKIHCMKTSKLSSSNYWSANLTFICSQKMMSLSLRQLRHKVDFQAGFPKRQVSRHVSRIHLYVGLESYYLRIRHRPLTAKIRQTNKQTNNAIAAKKPPKEMQMGTLGQKLDQDRTDHLHLHLQRCKHFFDAIDPQTLKFSLAVPYKIPERNSFPLQRLTVSTGRWNRI